MKDYRFNFGFLREWMKANKKTKRDVLNAIQTKNYSGLNEWMEGIRPMHIEAIIRLCNTFNIPLGCFFFDNNAIADINPPKPTENDQTLPTETDGSRGRGVKDEAISPVAHFHENSIIPKEKSENIQVQVVTDDLQILKMELNYERRINELNENYNNKVDEIRKNYEKKISERMEQLKLQQKEIILLRQELRRLQGYRGGAMVADDTPFAQDGEV